MDIQEAVPDPNSSELMNSFFPLITTVNLLSRKREKLSLDKRFARVLFGKREFMSSELFETVLGFDECWVNILTEQAVSDIVAIATILKYGSRVMQIGQLFQFVE